MTVALSGRSLCDGAITRPEDSYRVWLCHCVCDVVTSAVRRPWPELGCCAQEVEETIHPPHVFIAWCLIKHRNNIAFYKLTSFLRMSDVISTLHYVFCNNSRTQSNHYFTTVQSFNRPNGLFIIVTEAETEPKRRQCQQQGISIFETYNFPLNPVR